MPRAPSDEEIQLRKRARRRLVGAILLVTAAVVILPMVLDQEPRPVTQDIAIHIPSKGSGSEFAPRVAPSAEAPRAATQPPAARPAPAAPEATRRAEPAAEAPKPKAEPEKAEPEAPKPALEQAPEPATRAQAAKAEAAPAAKAEAFVVQLDAFSNPDNAKQQQKRLTDAGIKSFTDTVRTQKGDLTRVRVGPYPSREQAEQMRDKLAALGVKAVVVAK